MIRCARAALRRNHVDIIWILLFVLLVLVGLVYRIGAILPLNHSASVRARYARSPEEVWQAITDVEGLPAWRKDLKSVERQADVAGRPAWIEHSRHGKIPLEVTEWEAPRKLATRIADDEGKLPFGGTWTWSIRPIAGGSELTIAENGFIRPALFRLLTHYVFGYTRTMEQYARDLGQKFGETTVPKAV